MEAEQRNPTEEQQIGPNKDCSEADAKPFSIRRYVWANRQKDIIRSWPFPVKYLEICLKHDIKNILPSFEPYKPASQICQGVGLNCAPEVNIAAKSYENKAMHVVGLTQEKPTKNEDGFYLGKLQSEVLQDDRFRSFDGSHSKCKDEANNHFNSDFASAVVVSINQTSSYMSRSSLTSTKRLRHKRRKHKQKKRSMADILAVAKYCTTDDLYKNRESSDSSIKCDDCYSNERCIRMACLERNCELEIEETIHSKEEELKIKFSESKS